MKFPIPRVRRHVALKVLFLAAAPFSGSAIAESHLRTVAFSGQQVPGAPPGVVFSSFGAPVLNTVGHTAFSGTLAGEGVNFSNSNALLSEGAGSLRLVARAGDQVPGAPEGVLYSFMYTPVLDSRGKTAFRGTFTGVGADPFSNNFAIFEERAGSISPVARRGDPAPGTMGLVFSGINPGPIGNEADQLAFTSSLVAAGATGSSSAAVYVADSGVLTKVVQSRDQAPGAEVGVLIGVVVGTGIDAVGRVAVMAKLSGPAVDRSNNSGLYFGSPGNLFEVAREGSRAPNAAPGVVYGDLEGNDLLGAFRPVGVNSAGQLAYLSSLVGSGVDRTNDMAFYIAGSGTTTLLARKGDQAPGAAAGVVFGDLDSHLINESGEVAFLARLAGSGVQSSNSTAIYATRGATLDQVARAGDQAPGAAADVVFREFNALTLSDSGQVAFGAYLSGGIAGAFNNRGVYATDRDGVLVEIARVGQTLDVDNDPLIEDLRTIASLHVFSSRDGRGGPIGLNQVGQVAFQATFTDSTSGIFVSNRVAIPEPAAASLLALGLAAMWRRRPVC